MVFKTAIAEPEYIRIGMEIDVEKPPMSFGQLQVAIVTLASGRILSAK